MVSVIIPVFNSENTIEKTIQSVLNQTYNEYEIIIVDDGSTDNSVKIVKEFIKKNPDKNIKLLTKNNGGVSSARNLGIKNACGEYVAFLDSDDEWLQDKLEKQINILYKRKDIDFIGCNRNNESIRVLFKKYNKLKKINFFDMLIKMFPQTSTVIVKKSVFDEIGMYDEKQKYAEDGNLWLRICKKKKCYMMPESLVITGGGKPNYGYSGLSSKLWEMEKGVQKNLKDMYSLKYINLIVYIFLSLFCYMKFLRRIIITKFYKWYK